MNFNIRNGFDIKIAGACAKDIAPLHSETAGYTLSDFRYLKPKVMVEEGQRVKRGQALMCDKNYPELIFVSPVSGTVEKVARGDRRVLLNIVVRREGDEALSFAPLARPAISGLNADRARTALLERGLWPLIRQRPYSKIADVQGQPSSIFVSALDSNPLAADPNFYLEGRSKDFQAGLDILKVICPKIFLCVEGNQTPSKVFTEAQGVEIHSFAGPHPRSNVSLHIEKLDLIHKSDKVVWTLRAQDVVAIGKTLLSGNYDAERIIAWAGPAAQARRYYRTVQLANLDGLPRTPGVETRTISGNVLSGRSVPQGGFLGFFDNSVACLEEGRKRRFLGWLEPGVKALSFSRTYLSALFPQKEYPLNTSMNGDHRAIVDSELYDRVQPLTVPTIFLFKTLLAGDIEEAERLGLWSVEAEDFALASFIDPCKNDFMGVVQKTFDTLHKEG